MHNVIIVVIIAAAGLTFQPHVVGRKYSDTNFKNVKMQQMRDNSLQKQHHFQDYPFKSNHSTNIKLPQYLTRIYGEKFKWPLIDLSSSRKSRRHSNKDHCLITRFDDNKQT